MHQLQGACYTPKTEPKTCLIAPVVILVLAKYSSGNCLRMYNWQRDKLQHFLTLPAPSSSSRTLNIHIVTRDGTEGFVASPITELFQLSRYLSTNRFLLFFHLGLLFLNDSGHVE